jgi:hypothetical protein
LSVSISVLLLMGLLAFMLIRFKAVGVGAAVVVLLFGFYLAQSPAASSINKVVTTIADLIPDI